MNLRDVELEDVRNSEAKDWSVTDIQPFGIIYLTVHFYSCIIMNERKDIHFYFCTMMNENERTQIYG